MSKPVKQRFIEYPLLIVTDVAMLCIMAITVFTIPLNQVESSTYDTFIFLAVFIIYWISRDFVASLLDMRRKDRKKLKDEE